jgi:integrase
MTKVAAMRGSLEPEPQVPTVADFVYGDFTKLVLPRFKPSTREGYEDLLHHKEHGLVALLGRRRLDAIGVPEQRLVEADAINRGAKPRYIAVVMHTVMREAYELGVIPRPARLAKLPPKSEKLPHGPPEQLVVAVLAAAEGWHRVALALAILAGLRMGEVRALRVEDVRFDDMVLFVRRTYSAGVLVDAPKGLAEQPVPMVPLLARVLDDAVAGKRPGDPVVTKPNGHGPSEGGIDGALRRIQELQNERRAEQGFPPEKVWSLHKFRHYFGTKVAKGRDPESLRRLLRHKDLTSAARYLHATAGDLRDAVALLPTALPGVGSGNGEETAGRPSS